MHEEDQEAGAARGASRRDMPTLLPPRGAAYGVTSVALFAPVLLLLPSFLPSPPAFLLPSLPPTVHANMSHAFVAACRIAAYTREGQDNVAVAASV